MDLTALACLNTTLTIYYIYIQYSPTISCFFFSQHGVNTKSFLYLINCLCNISSLLFQVMIDLCKLGCLTALLNIFLLQVEDAFDHPFFASCFCSFITNVLCRPAEVSQPIRFID